MKQKGLGHGNGKGTTTQDVAFRKLGMSAKDISSFCFPQNVEMIQREEEMVIEAVSSSSDENSMGMARSSSPIMELQLDLSRHMNAKLSSQQTSRDGRSSQRWSWTSTTTTSSTGGSNESTPVRLTTGCVPICQNGKILLVSASRKAEWVIPKGGWENDETMEESALRETLEEAGVMGIIGSHPLASVEVETRKARKRRLENSPQPTALESNTTTPESDQSSCKENKVVTLENSSTKLVHKINSSTSSCCMDLPPSLVEDSDQPLEGIKDDLKGNQHMDDTCSSVSSSSSSTVNYKPRYTHVRLAMFPLYVTNVLESWPENQRIRRIVDIDEAIQILQNRPELQAMVLKVKEQNLHLRTPVMTA